MPKSKTLSSTQSGTKKDIFAEAEKKIATPQIDIFAEAEANLAQPKQDIFAEAEASLSQGQSIAEQFAQVPEGDFAKLQELRSGKSFPERVGLANLGEDVVHVAERAGQVAASPVVAGIANYEDIIRGASEAVRRPELGELGLSVLDKGKDIVGKTLGIDIDAAAEPFTTDMAKQMFTGETDKQLEDLINEGHELSGASGVTTPMGQLLNTLGGEVTPEDEAGGISLITELLAGEAMGAPIIKGIGSLGGLAGKVVPKAKPFIDPLVRAAETTVDLTIGGKGFGSGELKETKLGDFVGKELDESLAKVSQESKLTDDFLKGEVDKLGRLEDGKLQNITDVNSNEAVQGSLPPTKWFRTASSTLSKVDDKFGTELLPGFHRLYEGRTKHLAQHGKSTKFVKSMRTGLEGAGVQADEAFDMLDVGSKVFDNNTGEIINPAAFNKYGANKQQAMETMTQVKKYFVGMSKKIQINRFNKINKEIKSNIINSVQDPKLQAKLNKNLDGMLKGQVDAQGNIIDEVAFRNFNRDNKELLEKLKKGLSSDELKQVERKFKSLNEYNPGYEHIDEYIRHQAVENPLIDSLFNVDSTAKTKADALGGLLNNQSIPSQLKKRKSGKFKGTVEKDIYKLLSQYDKSMSWYTNVQPELIKIGRQVKKLRGRELLDEKELFTLKDKLGNFLVRTAREGDLDKLHGEFGNMLKAEGFTGNELLYVDSFFKKNAGLLENVESFAKRAGVLDGSQLKLIDDAVGNIEDALLNKSKWETPKVQLLAIKEDVLELVGGVETKGLKAIGRQLQKLSYKLNRVTSDEVLPQIFKKLDEFKEVANAEGKNLHELTNMFTPGDTGKLEGDIGTALDKFFKQGAKVNINTDASKFAEDWILRTMGQSNLGDSTFGKGRILSLMDKWAPPSSQMGSSVRNKIGDMFNATIDPNATWEDMSRMIQNYAYSNLLGFRTFNVLRNLTQPILHTAPRLGVNPAQEFKAMAGAYRKMFDKNAWQEYRNAGLKSGRVVNEWDTQIKRLTNKNNKFAKILSKLGTGEQKAAMFLFDTSDTVNRFISYHAGKEAAQSVMRKAEKGNTGALKKLLRPIDLKESERTGLLKTLKDDGSEAFVESYAKIVTNKTQFIYDAIDRSPALNNELLRLMFMFTKWPTEIVQRHGHYLKNVFGKGKSTGTRVGSATRMARDFATTSLLFELGKEAGWDLSGVTPMSALSVPSPSPYMKVLSGDASVADIFTPVPAIGKTLDRLGGNDKYDAGGVPKLVDGKLPQYMKNSIVYPFLNDDDEDYTLFE